ncbi:MAG: hypothetical protein KUG77_16255 [Nannocystaceae bacterium]|nr:hypothetical protein [Nannocystaceae bacterium]
MKTVVNTALLVLAASAVTACVTAPHNDQWVDPDDVDFHGYAETPGATVEIRGLDSQTNDWVTVRSVPVSSTPFNYGGETLYQWSAPHTDTTAVSDCVWGVGPSCTVPAGLAVAKFQVREVEGQTLITFDEGGVDCVIDAVSAGTNWFTAATSCASSEFPTLTLKALT